MTGRERERERERKIEREREREREKDKEREREGERGARKPLWLNIYCFFNLVTLPMHT